MTPKKTEREFRVANLGWDIIKQLQRDLDMKPLHFERVMKHQMNYETCKALDPFLLSPLRESNPIVRYRDKPFYEVATAASCRAISYENIFALARAFGKIVLTMKRTKATRPTNGHSVKIGENEYAI